MANNETTETKRPRNTDIDDKENFLSYRREIDDRHDKEERMVRISRDINIESKRIIFLLHRCAAVENEKKKKNLLREAKAKIDKLLKVDFLNAAKELDVVCQYLYSAKFYGFEEFIEAWAFYKFIESGELLLFDEIANALNYEVKESETEKGEEQKTKRIFVGLSAETYLLGIGDIAGELMRFSINQMSAGNHEAQHETLTKVVHFMRQLYKEYVRIGNPGFSKDLSQKTRNLRQSLEKVENALYQFKIRTSEVPEHMLDEIVPFTDHGANPRVSHYQEEEFDY